MKIEDTICGILILLALMFFCLFMFWVVNKFMSEEKKPKYITSKKKTIEFLEKELRKKDAELDIYRMLLKNVVNVDAIKKIVENSNDKTIKEAKQMSNNGFFGG